VKLFQGRRKATTRARATTKARAPRRMAAAPGDGKATGRRLALWAGISVLLAGGGAALWQAGEQAASSPQFRVAALEVRGLRLLSGEEILAASGVRVGDRLFDVDVDGVAQRLDSLVWVRSARVERKPPDRLVVHLEERRRVAWLEWRTRPYGIDADGVLLPADRLPTEGIVELDLPVLRVPGLSDSLQLGEVVTDSSVTRLLNWWAQVEQVAPGLASEISQVEPFEADALRLRLVADNLEVRLPYDRQARRLATLREVLHRVYGDCPNPAYVDLRFDGQAVVGRRTLPAGAGEVYLPAQEGEPRHG
jgi:cell division protein FtsQ